MLRLLLSIALIGMSAQALMAGRQASESMYDREKREGWMPYTRTASDYREHHQKKLKEVKKAQPQQETIDAIDGCPCCEQGCSGEDCPCHAPD